MTREDFWISTGAVVTAISAGLSFLWNIGILQILFTFLTGAFVTFIVESKLQDRAAKRRLRIEHTNQFYIPIFLVIENIKENLLLNLQDQGISQWHQLVKQPEMFTLEKEFKNELVDFFKKTQKIVEDLEAIKRVAWNIIHKGVREYLLPSLISLPKKVKNPRIDDFGIKLNTPHVTDSAPIRECAILDEDPIQFINRKYENKTINKVYFSITPTYLDGGSYVNDEYQFPIEDIEELFKDFWKKVVVETRNHSDIKRFNSMREELIPVANHLSSHFKKYIEKYVAVEKEL